MQETGRKTVTLVLGGVRSGKSRWALELAARAERVATVATESRSFGHVPDAVASLFKPGGHWPAYVCAIAPVLGVAGQDSIIARSALDLGKYSNSGWNPSSGTRVMSI